MEFKDQVQQVLDELRPSLQADGGDLELVDANEETGIIKVMLQGHCQQCPMSEMTLKFGIEQALKQKVKGVKEVINVNK